MNASDQPSPATTRHAPLALWRVAEAFMHTLYALFGAPEDVAAEHTLTRAAHTLMASWLRCAEALLRRLLLIEAAAHAKPNTRPLLHKQRHRVRKAMGFSADNPEAWRVSFRCLLHPPPRRGGGADPGARPGEAEGRALSPSDRFAISSPASGGDKKRFHSAWPLAERYEALLRVINNPEPFARRLARKLHALPHRIRELFRAPPEAQHRIDRFDALTSSAEDSAATVFNSS